MTAVRTFAGAAHVVGDNVDTDRIIPGKYTKTLDTADLAAHLLEDYDPELAGRIAPGDVLVAGENFGCGSSREQAPLAIAAAGIAVVLARSFARIFFRNAINIGLPVVEVPGHEIQPGARVRVDLIRGEVVDETAGRTYRATRMPPVMADILAAGGLVPYLRSGGDYSVKG
ncbi:MAG TPA: 3-isopropylmalate dehydratase small subunit [Trueperaceae bacterium]|nr:3-isopropylmalate dehydratase small subunit [Trueperaceae bacterium]